jgi:O-antigen/teichoic acid export membrane protein
VKTAGSLFSGLLIIGSGAMMGRGSEYFSRLIVGRWLGPAILGNVTLVFTIFSLFVSICILELTSATMHFARRYTDQGNRNAVRYILCLALAISTTMSLCMSIWLLFMEGGEQVAEIFGVLHLAIVFHFFYNHLLALHHRRQVVWFREIVSKVGRILGIVFVVAFIPSLGGLTSVYLMSLALPGVWGTVYFVKKIFLQSQEANEEVKPSWQPTAKTLITYSWPLTISGLVLSVSSRFDIFSVGYFLSQEDLGLYSVAIINSTIFLLSNYVLNEVFLPIASTLTVKNKRDEIASLYKASVRWSFYLLLPIAILLLVRGPTFLSVVFGRPFVGAASAMRILIIGYVLTTVQGPWPAMILSHELSWFALVIRSVLMSSMIIFNLLLVPRFGLLGAAGAMTLTHIIVCSVRIYLLNHKTGIHPFSRRLFVFIGAGGGGMMTILLLLTPITSNSLYGFLVDCLVCASLTLFVIWKMGGFHEDDRAILESLRGFKNKFSLST